MKKLYYLPILLIIPLFLSCSSSSDEQTIPTNNTPINDAPPAPPVELTGEQVFLIDFVELTAKTSVLTQKNLEPAFALISVSDNGGTPVLTREKVDLIKEGDLYRTSDLTLSEGTYALTEFIITDENETIISLVPKESSALARFASAPLPFDFEVSGDETNEDNTENVDAAGYTSVDFGYTDLSLTFPQNTDFFSLIVDDSQTLSTKILKLESITGSIYLIDWGDETIEEYVSNVSDSGFENTISHDYVETGEYTITISGPLEAIELLDFGSDQDASFRSHLTSINVEKLTLLKTCQLFSGELTTLNTSENKALEFLSLGNNQVESLDLIENQNLKTVWLRFNQLTELNISQSPELEFLSVEGNEISNFDFSNNLDLKVVLARENALSNVDFSLNVNLERVDLSDNLISNIDFSSNTNLKEINVGANQLSSIDLSSNIALERIDLYQNQLSSINLSALTNLRDLYIDTNLLSEIDVSNNLDLERLIIENNNLTSLDLTNNPKVLNLEIGGNQFDATQLDQIIAHIHQQAVANSILNGYMDFKNNPGFDGISNTSLANINELIVAYNWFFNNNQ